MDAITIAYSGESDARLWIDSSALFLDTGTVNEIGLKDSTLGDLVQALNSIDGISATLICGADEAASGLNPISRDYPADVKSKTYFLGHGNYSSPKMISEISHKNADEIPNSWLDDADAIIESLSGLNFRAKSIEEVSIDIRSRDVFCSCDYGVSSGYNGLYLRQYAPINSIEKLEIDGVPVTPSRAIIDYDRIILTGGCEIREWPIGKSKAKISLTYGYPSGSRESVLASEFAALYVCSMLHQSELNLRQKQGATKITHASVVFENDTASEEALSRKEIELRMEMILEHLPKKLLGAIG